MNWLNELWYDESGSVVSAELVLLGTLGAVGAGVAASAVGDSAELELEEVAYSLRSADQSYRVNGFQGCGAWTAGSAYTQPPVEESRAALREQVRRDRAALQEQLRDERRADELRERERDERMEDGRRQDRRRRMRERELQRRNEQRDDRWDGNERPRNNDEPRAADESGAETAI